MLTGRVKLFRKRYGIGFISRSTGERDVFFHTSDLVGRHELNLNDLVEFEIGQRIRRVGVETGRNQHEFGLEALQRGHDFVGKSGAEFV